MSGISTQPFTAKIHVSLNVADVDRAVEFYQAFLGVPVHKRRPGYANFDVEQPPLKLALEETGQTAEKGALNHLGIQVASVEQVDAARERLISAGLATFDEGDTTCCYARQNKVWATDPDGNQWEVYVLLDDMMDEDEEPEVAEGAVCCGEAAPTSPCCSG